jgi:hypothetical protein
VAPKWSSNLNLIFIDFLVLPQYTAVVLYFGVWHLMKVWNKGEGITGIQLLFVTILPTGEAFWQKL